MWSILSINIVVIGMNKVAELPLVSPIYSTYHNQGLGSAVIVNNPSIRNWYMNQVMILTCNRKFLSGFTTPQINITGSSWRDNPYLDKIYFPMRFLNGYINPLIRNLIDSGYYVCFEGVDDYYVKGKSWYKERHFSHDGAICGYNREEKTYCIYAYDSNWIYRKFWTPQASFHAGRKALFQQGQYGYIIGIKPKKDVVVFSADAACRKIAEYLDSDLDKYPMKGEGNVFGIVVHDYIAKYVGKLFDGSIPYEKMDRRVFRLIWEHKKAMGERIGHIENALNLKCDISKRYDSLIVEADTMRMLYASHHMKQRNSVLPIIQKKLLALKETETQLLTELLKKSGGVQTQ